MRNQLKSIGRKRILEVDNGDGNRFRVHGIEQTIGWNVDS
jgi:hypothetical protein